MNSFRRSPRCCPVPELRSWHWCASVRACHRVVLVPTPPHTHTFLFLFFFPLSSHSFTAYRALFTRCKARPGEWVLVHGASGAVGIPAVQMAIDAGMKVIGTAGGVTCCVVGCGSIDIRLDAERFV